MARRVPPDLPGTPVLGVLPAFRRDVIGTLERAHRECGDVVRLQIGPPHLGATRYAFFHPDHVRRALATEADRYRKDTRLYEEARWGLGDGLLNSQDERWKRQRRFIQPLFTRKRIAGYARDMGEEAAALAPRWRGAIAAGEPIDVHAEMSRVTLRVVGRLLFGSDMERTVPVMAYAFPLLGDYMRRRAFSPVRLPREWPLPSNRRAHRARAALHRECDELIATRRARGATGDDLIGLLIAARDGDEALDDAEIRDQVLIFLLAGHDTTAIALTFALHLLGRHPQAQARVREEVEGVAGDRDVESQDVERLSYTTMVLKEAMRLYPPAWSLGRRVATDDEVGGYPIPARTDVLLSPWITHRHPEFWKAPERFDPERFRPDAEAARHRHAYLPFGAGPRACLGQHFSMLEATILLAVIVRAHALESLADHVPLAPRITLNPAGPVLCRMKAVTVQPSTATHVPTKT